MYQDRKTDKMDTYTWAHVHTNIQVNNIKRR